MIRILFKIVTSVSHEAKCADKYQILGISSLTLTAKLM